MHCSFYELRVTPSPRPWVPALAGWYPPRGHFAQGKEWKYTTCINGSVYRKIRRKPWCLYVFCFFMYVYIYICICVYICVVSSAITGVSCKLPHHQFLDCKSPGWWFQPIRNMLDVHWMLHLSKGGQATTMRLKPSCNQTWQSWKIMENPSFSSMISSSKIAIIHHL